MQLSHYSYSDTLDPYTVSQHKVGMGKPRGLWVSVDDDDDTVSCGWKIAYTQVVQEIGGGKAA